MHGDGRSLGIALDSQGFLKENKLGEVCGIACFPAQDQVQGGGGSGEEKACAASIDFHAPEIGRFGNRRKCSRGLKLLLCFFLIWGGGGRMKKS